MRGAPPIERLLSRTEREDTGCLTWTGHRDKDGYGRMFVNGRLMLTHRLAYELVHGSIPDGMMVIHSCDRPSCCEVDHLRVGTHDDNMRDMVERGRQCRGARRGVVTRKMRAAMPPKRMKLWMERIAASMTPELRLANGRKAALKRTHESRRADALKGWATRRANQEKNDG